MKNVSLSDLNIYDIGNTINLAGMIYADANMVYLCPLATVGELEGEIVQLKMDSEDWKKFLRQTDLQEIEVVTPEGKAILRKSQRMIEAAVSWRIYERAEYRCEYCGVKGVPLTVDHVVAYELGGPSIEENLKAACRKCNKARGNKSYQQWIESEYYRKVSENLSPDQIIINYEVVATIPMIPLVKNIRSR